MAIEIVSFPIENGDVPLFHSFLYVYQRVITATMVKESHLVWKGQHGQFVDPALLKINNYIPSHIRLLLWKKQVTAGWWYAYPSEKY